MPIEQPLKQRLVGIAVIVSLAVIFLPMLLDGAGMVDTMEYEQSTFEVPPPPKIERRSVDLEEKSQALEARIERIPALSHALVDESNKKQDESNKKQDKAEKIIVLETPKTTTKPKIEKKIGGDSWIVQIGSFKDQEKAFKLQNKVRAYKLSAVFIQKTMIEKSKKYRVRMGPFLYQKQAKAAAKKLTDEYKIKSIVMKHEQ